MAAALIHSLDHESYGNVCYGSFWMGFKIDFSKYPTTTIGDWIFGGKVADGWLVRDSWYRMPTASTSVGTVDIGFGAAGQSDIASAVDLDGSLLTWTQGTITSVGNAELEITANEHFVLTVDTAVATDGVLEVMYLVMAGIDENTPSITI
jgi:hypothetical protein